VLVSPISWTHHQIWLLIAACGVSASVAYIDWAQRLLILTLMIHGLPDLSALGPIGAWVSDNHALVLAAYIVCVMPIAGVGRARTRAVAHPRSSRDLRRKLSSLDNPSASSTDDEGHIVVGARFGRHRRI